MSRDVSAVSGSFVDPLKLNPVRVSVGTVQYLIEKRYFPMHAGSPLHALAKLKVAPEEKNGKELLKLGVPAHPDPDAVLGGKGRVWFDALKIAGSPEARLEYTELGGPQMMTVEIVLGRGKAVMLDLDTNGLSVSPSLSYNDLLKPLTRHVSNAELGFEKLNLWQSQMKTIGWVFANLTKLPKAVFEQRVATASKLPPAEVQKVTKELVGAKLLTVDGDSLCLNAQLTAFVERGSTGLVCELLLTPYDAKGKALERRELRFFGKPGDRITVLTSKDAALKQAGVARPDEPLVTILSLDSSDLRSFLQSFLGAS